VPLTAERKSVHCPSLLDLCDITCEDFIQAITAAKESSDDAGWAGGFVGKRWDTMLNELAPGRNFEVYKYANTKYLCYKRSLSHGRSTRAAPARAAGPAFPIEDVLDWGDVDGKDVPLAYTQLHQDLKSTCKALVTAAVQEALVEHGSCLVELDGCVAPTLRDEHPFVLPTAAGDDAQCEWREDPEFGCATMDEQGDAQGHSAGMFAPDLPCDDEPAPTCGDGGAQLTPARGSLVRRQ
jgi:hypothetical protein